MTDSDSSDDTAASKRQGACALKRRSSLTNLKKESGCGRSIPVMALPTHTPGGERALIFPRIESFLTSFGLNGRACLKRAVCEVHELPLKDGFGMLGEFLTLFLRYTYEVIISLLRIYQKFQLLMRFCVFDKCESISLRSVSSSWLLERRASR